MDKAGIEKVLQTYFDASFEYSAEKMDTVFRPEAHVYGMEEGKSQLNDIPRNQFVELVRTLKENGQHTQKRRDEIHSIEFLSDAMAIAKVSLLVDKTFFLDILSFVCVDGKWQIISKLSYGKPAAE